MRQVLRNSKGWMRSPQPITPALSSLRLSAAPLPSPLPLSSQGIHTTPSQHHGGGHGHSHGTLLTNKEASAVLSAGLLSDFGLALMKGAAGILSGSSALISDAIHSTSDMAISLSAMVASKLAAAKPDNDHPYGHGRYDSLGALVVASVLTAAGGSIGYKSMEQTLAILDSNAAAHHSHGHTVAQVGAHADAGVGTPLDLLLHPEKTQAAPEPDAMTALWDMFASPPDVSSVLYNAHAAELLQGNYAAAGIAVGACLLSVGVKEWIYRWTMKVGMASRSNVMIANAYHHRADSLSSLVAVVGIGGAFYGVPVLDPIAGMVVAGMIVKVGLDTGITSVRELMDERLDDDVIATAVDIARAHDDVKGVRNIRSRRMGPSVLLDMECAVTPGITVSAAHRIAQRLRAEMFRERKEISEVLIHFVPANPDEHIDAEWPSKHQLHAHGQGSSRPEEHGHSHGADHSHADEAEVPLVSIEEISVSLACNVKIPCSNIGAIYMLMQDKIRKLVGDMRGVKSISHFEVHAESASSHLLHVHARLAVDMNLTLRDALTTLRRAKTQVKEMKIPVTASSTTSINKDAPVWTVSVVDIELDSSPV